MDVANSESPGNKRQNHHYAKRYTVKNGVLTGAYTGFLKGGYIILDRYVKRTQKFLDHAQLIKTTPIFIAGGIVVMRIVTINVVMVVIRCALIEVQDSKSIEKADME